PPAPQDVVAGAAKLIPGSEPVNRFAAAPRGVPERPARGAETGSGVGSGHARGQVRKLRAGSGGRSREGICWPRSRGPPPPLTIMSPMSQTPPSRPAPDARPGPLRPRRALGLLAALMAAAAFGGFAATWLQQSVPPARANDGAVPVPAASLPAVPAASGTPLPSLAPMLKRVLPAVVSVHSKQRVRVSPFGNDPFFRRMFPELTQERINQSLG